MHTSIDSSFSTDTQAHAPATTQPFRRKRIRKYSARRKKKLFTFDGLKRAGVPHSSNRHAKSCNNNENKDRKATNADNKIGQRSKTRLIARPAQRMRDARGEMRMNVSAPMHTCVPKHQYMVAMCIHAFSRFVCEEEEEVHRHNITIDEIQTIKMISICTLYVVRVLFVLSRTLKFLCVCVHPYTPNSRVFIFFCCLFHSHSQSRHLSWRRWR